MAYPMKNIKTFEDFTKNMNEEAEGIMYKKKLEEIAKDAMEINNLMSEADELEAWVQDKITIAAHNMSAILDYMQQGEELLKTQKPITEEQQLNEKMIILLNNVVNKMVHGAFGPRTSVQMRDELKAIVRKAIVPILTKYDYLVQ